MNPPEARKWSYNCVLPYIVSLKPPRVLAAEIVRVPAADRFSLKCKENRSWRYRKVKELIKEERKDKVDESEDKEEEEKKKSRRE